MKWRNNENVLICNEIICVVAPRRYIYESCFCVDLNCGGCKLFFKHFCILESVSELLFEKLSNRANRNISHKLMKYES